MYALITNKKDGSNHSLKWWDRFDLVDGQYIGFYRDGGQDIADPISQDVYNVEIIENIENDPTFDSRSMSFHGVNESIAIIVNEQLAAYYGYDYFLFRGSWWKSDLFEPESEAYITSINGLIQDAIDYRTEVLCEEYGDVDDFDELDPYVMELRQMEGYLSTRERFKGVM